MIKKLLLIAFASVFLAACNKPKYDSATESQPLTPDRFSAVSIKKVLKEPLATAIAESNLNVPFSTGEESFMQSMGLGDRTPVVYVGDILVKAKLKQSPNFTKAQAAATYALYYNAGVYRMRNLIVTFQPEIIADNIKNVSQTLSNKVELAEFTSVFMGKSAYDQDALFNTALARDDRYTPQGKAAQAQTELIIQQALAEADQVINDRLGIKSDYQDTSNNAGAQVDVLKMYNNYDAIKRITK